jgi:hypothetical protein
MIVSQTDSYQLIQVWLCLSKTTSSVILILLDIFICILSTKCKNLKFVLTFTT